ncbi:hypothetical protein OHA98_32770 [Streptomyces sp. NBC_00654]|uniref:hypothetical protein n=1 Tax=Streptomyces sp. NBC_00654 TaxID=2975799 RepID=UPI002254F34F|nr:hypothetical protein [Streptomyces sp. NBC_00654]MCX4969448.1 hypothetical protein [Streptomyces sp. NBC_00654]
MSAPSSPPRVHAAIRRNPYGYMLSDAELTELLTDLGRRRAASIQRNHTAAAGEAPRGPYPRPAMGFVILDPTADAATGHTDAVLAALTVGEQAAAFLPKAAAKAAAHRRIGHNNGSAAHTDPHLMGSGAFRYGHSAEVRGVIVAASSQSTDQDLYEASRLAAELVEVLGERHRAYEWRQGETDWLAPEDRVPEIYREMVAWFPDDAPGAGA